MCGLAFFRGTSADRETLTAAAKQAAKRGPHSYGWAWWNGRAWERHVGVGALPAPPDAALAAPLVVGHSRLATCGSVPGDQPPASESQPFVAGGWLIAHNGTVAEPDRLHSQRVAVDSEAILLAISAGATLSDVLSRLGDAPQALIAIHAPDNVVLAVRQSASFRPGHPLWSLHHAGGTYLCSRPFNPGCVQLPEGVSVL